MSEENIFENFPEADDWEEDDWEHFMQISEQIGKEVDSSQNDFDFTLSGRFLFLDIPDNCSGDCENCPYSILCGDHRFMSEEENFPLPSQSTSSEETEAFEKLIAWQKALHFSQNVTNVLKPFFNTDEDELLPDNFPNELYIIYESALTVPVQIAVGTVYNDSKNRSLLNLCIVLTRVGLRHINLCIDLLGRLESHSLSQQFPLRELLNEAVGVRDEIIYRVLNLQKLRDNLFSI